jgi:hypothetical protein
MYFCTSVASTSKAGVRLFVGRDGGMVCSASGVCLSTFVLE